MFLLVTRLRGRRQDGKLSKCVVCLCITESHIKVEIQNINTFFSFQTVYSSKFQITAETNLPQALTCSLAQL